MSPVSSVESRFFSSFGWKVPMPMRSSRSRGAFGSVMADRLAQRLVQVHEAQK
jgi:hypothetical protein